MKRVIFHELKRVDEALKAIAGYVRTMPVERAGLLAAYGRVLAEDVYAPIDVPPFDRATMDGFAVRAEDTYGAHDESPRVLRLVGAVDAGDEAAGEVNPGEAVEVATGAPLPRGADAVVMVEYTSTRNGHVYVYRSVVPGENVLHTGSDIMLGELVLRRCTVLGPREIGVLAALGMDAVPVYRPPRVAVISTGNELVPPGQRLGPGKVYDINAYTISSSLMSLGAEPHYLGIVRDDEEEIRRAVDGAASSHDLVLLSGGTSAGLADLTYRVLEELGPPGIIVHGLKVKPGKPTVVSVTRGGTLVVGLPGYPSSALVIFHLVVAPILRMMTCRGPEKEAEVEAVLASRIEGGRGRRTLYPVSLVETPRGLMAYPLSAESGAITTVARADGYLEIHENVEYLEEGEKVSVRLFSGYRPAEMHVIGSHDIALDRILVGAGVAAKTINVGSFGGLEAVRRGDADIAGIHLLDEETGTYNVPFLEGRGIRNAVLVGGYLREQVLMFPRGNPKGISGIRDLLRGDIIIVNRQRGTGTRMLLDSHLRRLAREIGVTFEELTGRIRGYWSEAKTHTAVAAAVAQGRADVGVGIRYAADMYGLDHITIGWERYDFLVNTASLNRPALARFLEYLRGGARDVIADLPGYRPLDDMGAIVWEPGM